MVLSKSNPHPCKIRNLDQIAVRNALEDPPVGLAAMDMIHIMFMGNYVGCRHRPGFATRARIRAQSLTFRGATARETATWMLRYYRLLHLSFKIWYLQVVRWSPAFEAAVADVQSHAEYASCVLGSVNQIHHMIAAWGRPDPEKFRANRRHQDFVDLPPPEMMDDAAYMSHGDASHTLGKLRKGSFITTLWDRMRSWMRSLCTEKSDLAQQYKEEMTQMMVVSKIVHSQPEYGVRVMQSLVDARRAYQDPQPDWRAGVPGQLDPMEPWCLGTPLIPMPAVLIHSFLKWEGDSALNTTPWFADQSFFLSKAYGFLDQDSLRAIDLAAWACARRTDGRFVMSWLRYPIGLSALAYQRLQNLYFSYECCDIADNNFLGQLRRFLFRRRRRVIPAKEYQERLAAKDPSIVHSETEPILRLVASPAAVPVAYRIVEEYATRQSRRDFAILYEYVYRVVAYSTWAVIPMPKWVLENQIEAVRQRFTIEPWCRTDPDWLGSHHLCACGRWCGEIVKPPLRSISSAAGERRRSLCPGTNVRRLVEQVKQRAHQRIDVLRQQHREAVRGIVDPALQHLSDLNGSTPAHAASGSAESTLQATRIRLAMGVFPDVRQAIEKLDQKLTGRIHNIKTRLALTVSRIESEQPRLYNVVPTRRSSRSVAAGQRTVHATGTQSLIRSKSAGGITVSGQNQHGGSGGGSISILDQADVRFSVASRRWDQADSMQRPEAVADKPGSSVQQQRAEKAFQRRLNNLMSSIEPQQQQQQRGSSATAATSTCDAIMVLPNASEVVSRDVQSSIEAHMIGDPKVALDQDPRHDNHHHQGSPRLVSKEATRSCSCGVQAGSPPPVFRVSLLGRAIRPKGPRTPIDGPWYTLCATCGCLTTLDAGRWDHRGPNCGAHGRSHRFLDRFAAFDAQIDGTPILARGEIRAQLASRTQAFPQPFSTDSDHLHRLEQLCQQIRSDLSFLDSQASLPCPDEIPCCWFCEAPIDQRPGTAPTATPDRKDDAGGTEALVFENPGPPAVRYVPGTSAATVVAGHTGAAIYAERLTLRGTHQAPPVRRINLRGSVFGSLDGHGSLLSQPGLPGHHLRPSVGSCATNGLAPDRCECIKREWVAMTTEERAPAGIQPFGFHDSNPATRLISMLERIHHRHSLTVESRILPVEMLPRVGAETYLLVFDDLSSSSVAPRLGYRCIYLCPRHMKDLRMGLVALNGRLVQIQVEKRAKESLAQCGGDVSKLRDTDLVLAARGQRVGRGLVVRTMFGKTMQLSRVLQAIKRGGKTRLYQQMRFTHSGARAIPVYTRGKKP